MSRPTAYRLRVLALALALGGSSLAQPPGNPGATPKTTDTPAKTGAGAKANKAAAKKSRAAPKAKGEGQPKGKKG